MSIESSSGIENEVNCNTVYMRCDDSTNAELQVYVVQTGPSYLPIFGQTNDCTSSVLSQNVQTADQNCKKPV